MFKDLKKYEISRKVFRDLQKRRQVFKLTLSHKAVAIMDLNFVKKVFVKNRN